MSAGSVLADYIALAAEREGISPAEALLAAAEALAARGARMAGPWELIDGIARGGDDRWERLAVIDGQTLPIASIREDRRLEYNEETGDDEYVTRGWDLITRILPVDVATGRRWSEPVVYPTLAAAARAADARLRAEGWALPGPAEPPER